jgi:hypothetical protein
MAVAARVVGDDLMGAVFTARDMTQNNLKNWRCGAAVLDRRHHFQLAEAHMAGVGLTPSRAMVAEDIRDLQDNALHEKWVSGGRFGLGGVSRWDFGQVQTEPLQRTRHVSDRVDGDARVKRRRFELGVSEQTRVIMLIGTVQRPGGSSRLRHLWAWRGDWIEHTTERSAKHAVVDRAADLKKQIGASPRPAHLLRFIHSPVDQEVRSPFSN